MLLDHFFKIISVKAIAPQHYQFVVTLIPEHPVYEGHFPGNPVVPGVCSLQMIAECVCKMLGHPVFLCGAPVVKFLEIIRPQSNNMLLIDVYINDTDNMSLNATVQLGEKVVMSCRVKLAEALFSNL